MSPTHLAKLTRTLVLLVCAVSVTWPQVMEGSRFLAGIEAPWDASNERESDGEDGGEGSSGAETRPIFAGDRRPGRLDRRFEHATAVWQSRTASDDARLTGRFAAVPAKPVQQRSPLLRC